MNKWNLSLIKELINIKDIKNVEDDTVFDYLKIVDLNKVKYENTAKNVLFFFSYSTKKDLEDGFIINAFDQRKKADIIIKHHPEYTYVIDEETYCNLNEDNKNNKFIIVDNILDSIDRLYNYVNDNKRAKVVAVTGSVGKTTSVGLIEKVLRKQYKVFRVYSKRITPIILKANIINFINDNVDFITLEMSIYHHDHVEILSDLLKPDVAGLIGIDSSHLEFFNSIEDICKYKSSIFRYAEHGFYNNLDERVNKLSIKNRKLYFLDECIYDTKLNNFDPIIDNYEVTEDELTINNTTMKLFLNTELSIVQVLLAYKVGLLFGIDKEKIIDAVNNYTPVENRIQRKMAFGKKIVFDGDITTHERLKQLANHNYKHSNLIIRKFGSAENNKRFENVLKSLDKFTKVFVFDDIEYLKMLSSHPNVEVVNNHDFMNDLQGQIIYHYSGYYRSFKEYNENNLIELENEIYKIMKPED